MFFNLIAAEGCFSIAQALSFEEFHNKLMKHFSFAYVVSIAVEVRYCVDLLLNVSL